MLINVEEHKITVATRPWKNIKAVAQSRHNNLEKVEKGQWLPLLRVVQRCILELLSLQMIPTYPPDAPFWH